LRSSPHGKGNLLARVASLCGGEQEAERLFLERLDHEGISDGDADLAELPTVFVAPLGLRARRTEESPELRRRELGDRMGAREGMPLETRDDLGARSVDENAGVARSGRGVAAEDGEPSTARNDFDCNTVSRSDHTRSLPRTHTPRVLGRVRVVAPFSV